MKANIRADAKMRTRRTKRSITITISRAAEDESPPVSAGEEASGAEHQTCSPMSTVRATPHTVEHRDADATCATHAPPCEDTDLLAFRGEKPLAKGTVKSIASRLAQLIDMDKMIMGPLSKPAYVAPCVNSKVEPIAEEPLVRPSSAGRQYINTLESIYAKIAEEKVVKPAKHLPEYQTPVGGARIREIISRTFSCVEAPLSRCAEKIVIPERSISFKDAFLKFEGK
ncbi:hypothetical protein PAPHI01_0735 [Pancytospora philotis]|nr:hypothetical protein PAPHI01_0735 [Pancytospora philotis]